MSPGLPLPFSQAIPACSPGSSPPASTPGTQGFAGHAVSACPATTQPSLHRPGQAGLQEPPPGTSGTLITQKLLDAQGPLLLLWRASGGGHFSSEVTPSRSLLTGKSETILRHSSGHQRLPVPTASPKASQPPHTTHHIEPGLLSLLLLLEMLFATQQHRPPHLDRQTDQRGHTHRKKCRALVLHRLLLRGMKKVLYVARMPTQLGLQPAAAWPALVPPGLRASTVTGGRGRIPQSSGTSPALLGAGRDGISARMGGSGGRGGFWGRRKTERWLGWSEPGRRGGDSAVPQTAACLSLKVSSQLPRGHGEIRPINDGLAEKHQLSGHQPWWCKGARGCSAAPHLCFAAQDEPILVHPGMQERYQSCQPPLGFRQISLITAGCLISSGAPHPPASTGR